jgi:tryptophan 7-halogenase
MGPDRRIRRIAVVGGGIAGWMAAAVLGRKLGGQCSIHVIDTAEQVAAGHAAVTKPQFLELLRFLGIDQNDFVDKTQSTYSLGSRFLNWNAPATSFWHPFGALGTQIERRPFYHFLHKAKTLGLQPKLEHFSQELSMAAGGRFIFPTNSLGIAQHMRYALHVDVALATRYLRTFAERAGTIRLERKVVSATRDESGNLQELEFEDGGKLRADLYLDCSGERGQLIGEIMGSAFEDWRQWLPCDRIVVAPMALEEWRPPYVRIAAGAAGWQWRAPLQQNLSAGLVYSSAHQDDETALAELRAAVGTDFLAEPRRSAFRTGRRQKVWDRNVVAFGAAAGCVDPLAGADLFLLANGLFNLLDHFPDSQLDPANAANFNAAIGEELEGVRDFTLLHYVLPRRADSPFWQQYAALELPEILARRIGMYRAAGRIVQLHPELFGDVDWFWIFDGMGVTPRDYDPLVDTVDFEQVKQLMVAISQKVALELAAAPSHDSFFAAANARLAGARKAAAAARAPG